MTTAKQRTLFTCKQAAKRLGVTDSRIRQVILEGKLSAEKIGERVIVIEEKELVRYERERGLVNG